LRNIDFLRTQFGDWFAYVTFAEINSWNVDMCKS